MKMMKHGIMPALVFCVLGVSAQHPNWQNKDLKTDTVFGISTEKAYNELLKDKKATTVVVAVIDGGVDTAHEDLAPIIWKNPKETYDGKDDDHNGYVNDVHGWDFIGGAHGDVNQDNLEITRLIRKQKPYYDSLKAAGIPANMQPGYDSFVKMQADYDARVKKADGFYHMLSNLKSGLDSMLQKIGKDSPTVADLQNYQPQNDHEKQVKQFMLGRLAANGDLKTQLARLNSAVENAATPAKYNLNMDFDPRPIVGDDYDNINQRIYGNPDVTGPDASHATHVSGIIGGVRNNGIGINGVADNVRIMSVRVVPDGDERDKDVANGIRYAADNGARVINMSFGKSYSPGKSAVDEAVKYALSKDVLIVHAAGNEASNTDSVHNFPNRNYLDGEQAGAWIEVGASGEKDDSTLVARFSNYGAKSVDVFAPGVQIYSSIPGSKYAYFNGTSMASPVVAGLAALIREYYPKLTAVQVKDIIMRSVVKVNHNVIVKDNEGQKISVPFSVICVSGGVVNTYNALELAKHYK
jgi:subtilisin family serine protease